MRRLACIVCVLLAAGGAASTDRAPTSDGNLVAWLQRYIRIDTTNPPGNEHLGIAYLAELLHREGITTRTLVTPRGRANLYARLPATVAAPRPALVLLHHVDVVAPGDGWHREPFAANVEESRIWGRGAIDTKSLGIAHLAALIDLARSGVPRHRDVVFVAAADEEQGGSEGVGWLLAAHPELFADIGAVLNEGGSNRTGAGGRLLWWGLEVAQKRPLWLRVTQQGRGGHGSVFNPFNPNHRLVLALERLLMQPPELRLTPSAYAYFAAIAPFQGRGFEETFDGSDFATAKKRFDTKVRNRELGAALMPGMHVFFQDTVQVTSIQTPSDSVNVVPATATALLDARLLPDTPVETVLSRVQSALGSGAELEVLLSAPPTEPSPVDNEVYATVSSVLSASAPVVPALITGTTDSRYFRERQIAAYGFSPFTLTGEEARGIHGADEGIPVNKFLDGVAVMRRVVRACVVP